MELDVLAQFSSSLTKETKLWSIQIAFLQTEIA